MSDSETEAAPVVQPRSIDLNADLGEGFPNDRALLDRVTSASICCGAHAGDAATIGETLRLAARAGVVVGAHPGFADRQGFGRRVQSATAGEVEHLILDQVADLKRLADLAGVPIRFVKPHGALYNQAQNDDEIARGVIAADVPALAFRSWASPARDWKRWPARRASATSPKAFPTAVIAPMARSFPAVSQVH